MQKCKCKCLHSAEKIEHSLSKKVWYNVIGIADEDIVFLVNAFCAGDIPGMGKVSYRESIRKVTEVLGDYPNRRKVWGILNKGKLHSLPLP